MNHSYELLHDFFWFRLAFEMKTNLLQSFYAELRFMNANLTFLKPVITKTHTCFTKPQTLSLESLAKSLPLKGET